MPLLFQLCSDTAKVPERASLHAAGFDLFSDGHACLSPGQRALIPTNVKVILDPYCYGRIAPRSGLAANYGVDVMAGVIDADYRGKISVLLINHGHEAISIYNRERIAQLIVTPFVAPQTRIIGENEYDSYKTTRGEGGLGSTGTD